MKEIVWNNNHCPTRSEKESFLFKVLRQPLLYTNKFLPLTKQMIDDENS